MTVVALAQGVVALLALLIIAGLFGGIGSVELLVWLVLVGAWVVGWMASRRKRDATL